MNQRKDSKLSTLANDQLLPREELYKRSPRNVKLSIGIPNNSASMEYSVPLTPQSVEVLVHSGHDVFIEKGAGQEANYSDRAYSDSGAVICQTAAEVFQCDIILKMAPFTQEESQLMKGTQLLLSPLYLSMQTQDSVRCLMRKKVTAVSFEYMKDEYGLFPVEQIFSEIMGNTSMIVASEYLSTARNGKGVILGSITGISPTEVIILGTGTAAEHAARTARAFGATVKIFDDSISKLMDFQSRLGERVFTSVFHPKALRKAMKTAEVLIGALSMNEVPKMVVPEEMVEGMKENSVIIDLNIIQGGCIETSRITNHKKPVYVKHGVIHYCVPNITSRVARTTSIAVSNILTPMLIEIAQSGGVNHYVKSNRGFCEGIYVYNGVLTNPDIGAVLNIPVTDINLLMAAF
ncbi:MAG: alanine dehydrogenase [Bacteroidia bacterium]|nr:alanine dehydrogenase [Bacteroidia bacterium]